MASKKKIDIELNFTSNYAKLKEVEDALYDIQERAVNLSEKSSLTDEFKNSANAAQALKDILDSSWNARLGQLDLSKFNKSIKQSFGNLQNMKDSLTQCRNFRKSSF